MMSSEKHRLRSVIPKPRDSDEEDPVVELNEEGEALNIESVTERLATDLKVAEDEEEEEGGGEKRITTAKGWRRSTRKRRRTSGGIYSSNTLSWHWRKVGNVDK